MEHSEASITSIKQLFTQAPSREQLSKMAQGVKSLEQNVLQQIPGFTLPSSFYQQMLNHTLDLLDIQIPPLLGKAWSTYQELRKYRDLEAYPADKAFFVPTAEHTFKHEYKPSLELTVNEMSLGTVTFVMTLELTLQGLMLKIQGGKILEIGIGSCVGKGTLACTSANIILLQKESGPVPLPGVMALGEGILIYDPSRDAQPRDAPQSGFVTRIE
jgi:hypothetical protein